MLGVVMTFVTRGEISNTMLQDVSLRVPRRHILGHAPFIWLGLRIADDVSEEGMCC